ncbi:hypothetical protein QQF64_017531 [Cirrhinus molitorella]|uniref:Uncharacterized protein n=2 Tax=Cirrhinus molitorella TaxID=172907 RepID=A0ABR3LIY2_9TELE|nr:hypothetical protein Q8A67_022712 [Cirrhinus molitorella]
MHDCNTAHNNEESRRGGPDKAFGMFLSTHLQNSIRGCAKQEWQMASKWTVQIVRSRLRSARSIRGEIIEMRYATSREGDGSPLLWQRSRLSFQHHGQRPANISTTDSAADPPSVRAPGLDVRSVERHRMPAKSHLSRTVCGSEGESYKLKVPDDWANSTCL